MVHNPINHVIIFKNSYIQLMEETSSSNRIVLSYDSILQCNPDDELFDSLEVLTIVDSNILSLPNWIVSLDLRTLVIKNCKMIESLPSNIDSFNNLEVLRIDGCDNLSKLPNSLDRLSSLKVLSVSNSGLIGLPENFGTFSNIDSLTIDACTKFEFLPETICLIGNKDSRLFVQRDISITKTLINKVPLAITNIKGLDTLDLSSNRFDSIPYNIFLQKSSLSFINLSGNLGVLSKLHGNIDVHDVRNYIMNSDPWASEEVLFGSKDDLFHNLNLLKYCSSHIYPPEDYEGEYWIIGFPDI